jgi:hypothetical protein
MGWFSKKVARISKADGARGRSLIPGMGCLGLILSFAPLPAAAQQQRQPCTFHFVMYLYDEDLGIASIPAMDSDQAKWLRTTGAKKYPDFCLDPQNASYVMLTMRWSEKKERTVTKTHSATTTGPVPGVVGVTAAGPGKPAEPIWGTQLRTFITTWREKETETVSEAHALVLTFGTKDGTSIAEGVELKPKPTCQAKGVGSKAARKAFEFTFEYLALLERGRANQSK